MNYWQLTPPCLGRSSRTLVVRAGTALVLGLTLATFTACSPSSSKNETQTAATITTQPANKTVADGATATFTVVGSGSGTLTYQWKKGTAVLSGATSASYTTPAVVYATDNGASYTVTVSNGVGTPVVSSAAILTVTPLAPAVTVANQTVAHGATATFTAVASGSAPLTYQWKRGTTVLTGATSATYTTPATAYAADNGATYTCTVTNGAGQSATSAAATLTVTTVAPTAAVASQTVNEGLAATFTVSATGTAPLTYVWKRGTTVITGATSATYTTPATTYAGDNASTYTCTVTNGAGQSVTSAPATLTVFARPTATVASQTVNEGQTATFTAVATGSAPLTYVWKRGTVVVGGNTATYTTPATVAADNGASFTVTVTTSTNQTVTSDAATLTVVPAGPTSTVASQTVVDGQPATFTVVASGQAPLTYVWKRGTTVVGTNATTYTTPATVWADDNGAVFTCAVTSGTTTVTSPAATLTVKPVDAVVGTPSDVTVQQGQPASFVAAVSAGTKPYSYQWNRVGTGAITGATAATYTLSSPTVAADNGAKFTVTVKNGAGTSTTSGAATLTVNPVSAQLAFTQDLVSKTAMVPEGATFTVACSGAPTTYTWKKNGAYINGSPNGPSYTVGATDLQGPVAGSASDVYTVTVTDGTSTINSASATLTLVAPPPVYAGEPTMTDVARQADYQVGLPAWSTDATPNAAFPQGSFRVGFDNKLHNPLWSAYGCFKTISNIAHTRKSGYPTDSRLRSPIDSGTYPGLIFSHGHMTPLAELAYRYGQNASDDSLYMSNMCPQNQAFNGGTWGTLETTLGAATTSAFGRIWIYTGPVFTSTIYPAFGGTVSVPDGFYKIVVRETTPGNPKVLAILMPHSTGLAVSDIPSFVTSVDRIQQLTGLNFFPTPATGTTIPAGFTTTVDVRGWGSAFEATGKPNVHIITPSWDASGGKSVNVATLPLPANGDPGVTLTFKAAVTSPNSTVNETSGTSWDFGDSTAPVSGLTATHAFTLGGLYTVKFTATDALGVSNSITRIVRITGANTAPVVSAIADQTSPNGLAKVVTFTASDDSTAPASLVVTATSSNQAVVTDASLVAVNTTGTTFQLNLTPATATAASCQITVNVKDTEGLTTSRTFTFTVGNAIVTPVLVISQYYEGTAYNKWIEVTNIGTSSYDGTTPMYLCLLSNPFAATPSYTSVAIPAMGVGESKLIYNEQATAPALTAVTGTPLAAKAVINFNGDDIVYISPVAGSSATTGPNAYAARTDAIGVNEVWWCGNTGTTSNVGLGAWELFPGKDRSYVRKAAVTAPNPTFSQTSLTAEWTQVDNFPIGVTAPAAPSAVDTAAADDTNRLGFHVYQH